jgi:hypothetical protein
MLRMIMTMMMIDTMLKMYCKFMLSLPKETPEILRGIYSKRGESIVGIIKY